MNSGPCACKVDVLPLSHVHHSLKSNVPSAEMSKALRHLLLAVYLFTCMSFEDQVSLFPLKRHIPPAWAGCCILWVLSNHLLSRSTAHSKLPYRASWLTLVHDGQCVSLFIFFFLLLASSLGPRWGCLRLLCGPQSSGPASQVFC